MYVLSKGVEPKDLRDYGFKPAHELPEWENWLDNEYWKYNMYLISQDPDDPSKPCYADEDDNLLLWEIHVMPIDSTYTSWKLWIDMTPCFTYHIDNMDTEKMFYILYRMIKDGVIEDDF